jgi:short-subunit dehydrogenase
MPNHKVLTVVGAGPGVGLATARRFGREGYSVGLVARSEERLNGLVESLNRDGVTAAAAVADLHEADLLRAALDKLESELGPTHVLCFSPLPDVTLIKPVTQTSAEDLRTALSLNAVAAATAVQQVLPGMRRLGGGTLLFTTGSAALSPSPERATSAIAYAAETVYVRLLHESLAPEGIHSSQLVIQGAIGPGLRHEPQTVAELLWHSHVHREGSLNVLK